MEKLKTFCKYCKSELCEYCLPDSHQKCFNEVRDYKQPAKEIFPLCPGCGGYLEYSISNDAHECKVHCPNFGCPHFYMSKNINNCCFDFPCGSCKDVLKRFPIKLNKELGTPVGGPITL